MKMTVVSASQIQSIVLSNVVLFTRAVLWFLPLLAVLLLTACQSLPMQQPLVRASNGVDTFDEQQMLTLMWANIHHPDGVVMNTVDSAVNKQRIREAMWIYDDLVSASGVAADEAKLASQRAVELASYIDDIEVAKRNVVLLVNQNKQSKWQNKRQKDDYFKANFYAILLGLRFLDVSLILQAEANIATIGEDLALQQKQLGNWLSNVSLPFAQKHAFAEQLITASSSSVWVNVYARSLQIHRQQHMQLAEQLAQRLQRQQRMSSYFYLQLAAYYEQNEQQNQAIAAYEAILILHEKEMLAEVSAHHRLALLYSDLGDFQNAHKHLKWLQLYVPRYRDWAFFVEGVMRFQQQQFQQAIEVLQEVASGTVEEFYAIYYQAYSHLKLQQLAAANDYLDDLLVKYAVSIEQRKTLLSDVLLLKTEVLLANAQTQQAIDLLATYVQENRVDTDVVYRLAILYIEQNRFHSAERHLRDLLKTDAQSAEVLNTLGYVLTNNLQRHHEALPLLLKANQLAPNQAHILDSLGWVYFHLQRYEESLPLLQQAVAIRPEAEVISHLVQLLRKLGREGEAQALLQRGLQQFPQSVMLQKLLPTARQLQRL